MKKVESGVLTDLLGSLFDALVERRGKPLDLRLSWEVKIGAISFTVTGGTDMAVVLTNDQKVSVAIQPVDRFGNVAKVDGIPVWSVSDPGIGALEAAADGLSAVFTTAGPLGVVQIQVQADADLGGGIKPLVGTLDIQVEAGEAVSLGLVAGIPEPK